MTGQTKVKNASSSAQPACTAGGSLRFSREARLLKHASFQHVYEKGRRHFSANLTAFYLLHSSEGTQPKLPARVGFTVGRVLGGSVVRNRIRRRMRDAVRRNLPPLQQELRDHSLTAEVVFNPKKNLIKLEPAALEAEVQRALRAVASARPPEQKS